MAGVGLHYYCWLVVCVLILFICCTVSTTPSTADLKDNALCILLQNTTLSEWSSIKNDFILAVSHSVTLSCSEDPSKCNISPSETRSLVLFTFADIIIHSYYPQQLFNGLEIAFSIQIPEFRTPVSSPAVVPMATMLDISEAISVNILAIIEKNATEAKICNSTIVVSPSPSPTIYYEFTEEQLRENYVMVTLGLTTLQQWEDDLSLQEAFTDSISSEATKYCSEYLEQCGLLNSVEFSSSDIIFQPNYPRQLEGMKLQVSIALRIPNGANLTTSFVIPLIPGNTLIPIALRAATPFYLNTGRPLIEIKAYQENSSNLLGIILGTSILSLLLIFTVSGIVIIYCVFSRQKTKRNEDNGYQLPGDNDVKLLRYMKNKNDTNQ